MLAVGHRPAPDGAATVLGRRVTVALTIADTTAAASTGADATGTTAIDAAPIDAVVLSPHFDDAALSLGGCLHRWSAEGLRVVVVTMCGGAPGPGPLSPFASAHHARWGAAAGAQWAEPRAAVEARRDEDREACAILGVEAWTLDVPDAIYRRVLHRGRDLWPYADEAALFGPPHRREAALGRAVADTLLTIRPLAADVRWLLPLAIGGHVDHRLARAAGELAAWRARRSVRYYADYPYARTAGAASRALAAEPRPLAAVDVPGAIDEAHRAAKIRAIAAYRSQLSTFWPDAAAMEADVRGWTERVWQPAADGLGRPTDG